MRQAGDHGYLGVLKQSVPTLWQNTKPGDRLWVKEGWRWNVDYHTPVYRAEWSKDEAPPVPDFFYRWRSPLHLARKDSRLTLTVTATKIEPVQAISEADAEAEGIGEPYLGDGDPPFTEQAIMVSRVKQFRNLWMDLHGKESWANNPEVVALSFTVEKAVR